MASSPISAEPDDVIPARRKLLVCFGTGPSDGLRGEIRRTAQLVRQHLADPLAELSSDERDTLGHDHARYW